MEMNEIVMKAIGAHGKWVYHIEEAIKTGVSEFNLATVKTDNNCEFGKWLYNDATAEFKSLPIYREIKDIHAKFHMEAGRVLALAVNGKKEEAKKGIGLGSEFRRLSSTLVLKLSSLKTRK